MKKTFGLACAVALFAALPMASYAQSSNTNSASQNAPGQQMQNDTTGSVTGQGASSYAPGQQKKLPTDSTGTTTQRK